MRKSVRTGMAALALAATLAAGSVAAEELTPSRKGTLVTLPVSAQLQLANDEATVQFYTIETDKSLSAATKRVLERVNQGLEQLKALNLPAQFQTQTLSSYPRYSPHKEGVTPEIIGWEVRQSISARISDVEQAPKLAQEIAKHFAFNGVHFGLSQQAQQKVQIELMQMAVGQVRAQAQAVAQSMGLPNAQIRVESLDFSGAGAPRMHANKLYMADAVAASAESMPLPAFEAGQTTLSRQLTARVRIE